MRWNPLRGLYHRWLGLPTALRWGAVVVVFFGVMFGSWKGYEYYDYVEHDNDFCASCHLMQDPFRRFTESGHRDLSCKACHKPTLVERSKMALTALLENPDEVGEHAPVPNEKCAACHIDGDPERWELIAATAGHRKHFESDAEELQGLLCVECHATAIHDFVPLDQTCAQAGCHVDVQVTLGAMATSNELHCVGCHNFLAEERAPLRGEAAITPRQQDCLGCHAMQERLHGFDVEAEPHEGDCASCHNPHEQLHPAEAAASCATAGCHVDVAGDAAPLGHRGLAAAQLADCLACHEAHAWNADTAQCGDCHDSAALSPITTAGGRFEHARHTGVACASCHDASQGHALPLIRNQRDCADCHHPAQAVASDCASCHADGGYRRALAIVQAFELSVAAVPENAPRSLSFEHARHEALACTDCHRPGDTPSALTASDCASCHAEHHEADRTQCTHCHGDAVRASHDADAHFDCARAGCHARDALAPASESDGGCLLCHAEQREHENGRDCAACHFPVRPGVQR